MVAPVILVTGSTDGIGKATVRELAYRGADVIIHGRDPEKGQRVLHDMKNSTGSTTLSLCTADFSEQKNVRRMAEEITTRCGRLDVLINNAGTGKKTRILTPDGIETTFAVNFLAPFLLTRLLLPLLEKSAPSRVVNISSVSHNLIKSIAWENLQSETSYSVTGIYALTKFANITFTYALARRIAGSGVSANCVNPGVVSTKLLKGLYPSLLGNPPSDGAKFLVDLALSPEMAGVSGEYFDASKEPGHSSPLTYDHEVQERLWRIAEELTGMR